jgi:hypothetical protein
MIAHEFLMIICGLGYTGGAGGIQPPGYFSPSEKILILEMGESGPCEGSDWSFLGVWR